MGRSERRRLLLWCVACVLEVSQLHAAELRPRLRPTLRGVVTTATGTPLPGVRVLLTELGRATTTNDVGEFVWRDLPAGTYHLTASLMGFRPLHRDVRIAETDVVLRLIMTATPLRLEVVNVTASPISGDVSHLTQSTAELSGHALQRTIGASLAQTLAAEPGVAMRFGGPAATMPVIRGLTGDRILVLQDGQRAGDLSAASADHGTTIDPLVAQRIEVVRGPASLLYGNNALGGVVNVISGDIPTVVPQHVDGYIGALAESATPGGAVSGASTIPFANAWALGLRGGARRAASLRVGGGGLLDNTQADNVNGIASVGYVGARGSAGLSVASYGFSYGLPVAPSATERTHLAGSRQTMTIRASTRPTHPVIEEVTAEATAQRYGHSEIADDGAVGTRFQLATQTLSATTRTRLGRVRGRVGVQGLFKQYVATGEEALTPAANTLSGGAFVYQEWPLKREAAPDAHVAVLQIGGRYDEYRLASRSGLSKFGPGRTVALRSPSGSFGLSVPLTATLTASGSIAQAFRAPTVEELFSNAVHAALGSYELGNARLRPEVNRGAEAQLRYASAHATANLSGFINQIRRFIVPDVQRDTIVDGVALPLAIYRQADALLRGFEGSAEVRLREHVVLGVMGDYTRGQFSETRAPLPFMPPGRAGLSLRWDRGGWDIGGSVRYLAAQRRVTGGPDRATDAYTLVNLTAGLTRIAAGRVHTVTLRLDNAADIRYVDATSRIKAYAQNPGRNLAIVYKVMF